MPQMALSNWVFLAAFFLASYLVVVAKIQTLK